MPNVLEIAKYGRVEYLPNRKAKTIKQSSHSVNPLLLVADRQLAEVLGSVHPVSTNLWGKKGRPNVRTSSRVFSAIILCIPIPTPSITANRIAHPMAEFLAALNPPRIANEPPVRNPAPTRTPSAFESLVHPAPIPCSLSTGSGHILAFQGSSFFRKPLTAQSNVENKPPHTPKFPPNTGARALMAVRAPIRRSP